MIITARKKPVVITAVLYTGSNFDEVREFVTPVYFYMSPGNKLEVYTHTEQAWILVPVGHYIIKGVRNEVYPCSPEVFQATYDILEGEDAGSKAEENAG